MSLHQVIRFAKIFLALVSLLILLPNHGNAAPLPNGLLLGKADPTAAQGVVDVFGVADHPSFRKWQLDLLLDGTDPLFLALGEERAIATTLLIALDTQLYPNGEHLLRLRVVYARLNYDEYFLPLRIANPSIDAATTQPPTPLPITAPATQGGQSANLPVAQPTVQRPNGLSLAWQAGLLSVRGVADHPTFRKWQIDLLPLGDANQPIFLGVGEERASEEREFLTLNPADYPEGEHQLRLRVIYAQLNYDEFLLPIRISGDSVAHTGTSMPYSRRGAVMARSSALGKAIYLTFDDGPHPRNTPEILEVLAEYNAKATFFVVGSQAQRQGALLAKIYEDGHSLANHSWSHKKLGAADWDTFDDEIGATARALGNYGSRCLRPPYGDVGTNLLTNAEEAGYTLVYWTVDSEDWKSQDPETIANQVLSNARPGAIVLLHDGGGSRTGTITALRTILATLTEDGYTFPTLCR